VTGTAATWNQEAGESPARSRHCDRGARPDRATALEMGGKAGASGDPGARILVVATVRPGRWTPRRLRQVGYDQGVLLEPVLGKAATAKNYLHEFFHDGRHLLGFPCH
jgi:hypothetical protein